MKNKCRLISVHEEVMSDGEIWVIFLNTNSDLTEKESVIGLFDNKTKIYVFFNSNKDLIEYKYYNVRTMQRAYYSEEDLDEYFDNGSDKMLSELLEYVKSE